LCPIFKASAKNILDFPDVLVQDHFKFDFIHVYLIVDEIELFNNFLDLLFGSDLFMWFLSLSMAFGGIDNFTIAEQMIILLVIFGLFLVVFLLDETDLFGSLLQFT
jgi:hypothetical protein